MLAPLPTSSEAAPQTRGDPESCVVERRGYDTAKPCGDRPGVSTPNVPGGYEGMQNPPPPPPPSYGQPPPPPPSGGGPPMMPPPGGGYAMATPGNLASPGMRIVGGLIDVVILVVTYGIIAIIFISAGDASPS